VTGGVWLDLLLAALVTAALVWLLRPRLVRALTGGGGAAGGAAQVARLLDRSRSYYPALARQAGHDPDGLFWIYWGGKALLALLLPLLFLELVGLALPGLGVGLPWLLPPALLGFALPDLSLLAARRARRRQIARSLSFFMDLLVAFLHTGMDLERAFRKAGREGFDLRHPLGREVDLVGRELDAGRDPGAAFDALAARTGVADLRAAASALRIGMKLGTSVRTTLEAQAEILWTKRRETALRAIHAASIKVMFPVMLCGFPIFILLTFFPALLEIFDALGSITDLLG
jgi:tight adherence protein C